MPTNPDELLQEAACFNCNSNASLADLLKLALLDRISESAGGGGVPGGADGQVQYNDGGVFGGSAGLTLNDATNVLTVGGNYISSDNGGYQMTSGGANFRMAWQPGVGVVFYESGTQTFGISSGPVVGSGTTFGWSSTATPGNTKDTALSRQSAGVVEVTDHLWADTLRTSTAFTVGGGTGLPAAGVPGRRAYVTDALGPAFGAVVVGGGAVVVPVFDDGTNWIVG